jgi:hypothetical protein
MPASGTRARKNERVVEVLGQHGERRGRLERREAGEAAVDDAADGVDVGAPVDLLAADLLRRHVERGAEQRAVAGGVQSGLVVADLGQAEVDDLDEVGVAGAGDEQDVLRLEVAVHDAHRVGFGEGVADLRGDAEDAGPGQAAVLADDRREVVAAEVLHHEVGQAAPVPVVEHLHGVDVHQLGGGLGLAPEAREHLLALAEGAVEDLHGDGLADGDVLGTVDGAHAAAADQRDEAVAVGDDLADQRIGEGLDRVDGGGDLRAAEAAETHRLVVGRVAARTGDRHRRPTAARRTPRAAREARGTSPTWCARAR